MKKSVVCIGAIMPVIFFNLALASKFLELWFSSSWETKAGVVKNWWWQGRSHRYRGSAVDEIPDIWLNKNPDNVLSASKRIPTEVRNKIANRARSNKKILDAQNVVDLNPWSLDFTFVLIVKENINPKTSF